MNGALRKQKAISMMSARHFVRVFVSEWNFASVWGSLGNSNNIADDKSEW